MLTVRTALLGVALLLCVAIAQSQDAKSGNEKNNSKAQPRGSPKNPLVVNVLPLSDADKIAAENKAERERKAEIDRQTVELTKALTNYTADLSKYTSDLADYTKLLLAVAALQLIVFGYQGLQLKRTVRATNNLVRVTDDSVELLRKDQRPWVSVDISIASPLTFDPNGNARITLRFLLRNVGRSPAANIDVVAVIYPMSQKRSDARLEQKKIAAGGLIERPTGGFFGEVLFPNPEEVLTLDNSLPINRAEIDESITEVGIEHQYFLPVIVGCVSYSFTFAGGRHQTGFIADLLKTDEAPKSGFAIDLAERTIPADKLRLRHRFGANID